MPMFTADELAMIRRAYAHQVLAAAETIDPRIEAAFIGCGYSLRAVAR